MQLLFKNLIRRLKIRADYGIPCLYLIRLIIRRAVPSASQPHSSPLCPTGEDMYRNLRDPGGYLKTDLDKCHTSGASWAYPEISVRRGEALLTAIQLNREDLLGPPIANTHLFAPVQWEVQVHNQNNVSMPWICDYVSRKTFFLPLLLHVAALLSLMWPSFKAWPSSDHLIGSCPQMPPWHSFKSCSQHSN